MADNTTTAVKIERAMEQLRQEREVFELRKRHEARWFFLRLSMGYSSILFLCAVILIGGLILFNADRFPEFTIKAASATIFVDVVGLMITVWKIVLKPDFMTRLTAETKEELVSVD